MQKDHRFLRIGLQRPFIRSCASTPLLLVAAALLCSGCSASSVTTQTPTKTSAKTASRAPKQQWAVKVGGQYPPDGGLTIAKDGNIYVGGSLPDSALHAVGRDGTKKWTFQNGNALYTPSVGGDGTVYVGAEGIDMRKPMHEPGEEKSGRWLYAIGPDGTKKWEVQTQGAPTSRVAINNGTIYFGTTELWGKRFYAVTANGAIKWEVDAGGMVDKAPAVSHDGSIYFVSRDETTGSVLHALCPGGKEKWRASLTEREAASSMAGDASAPVVGEDGTVYVLADFGGLSAFNSDGSRRWKKDKVQGSSSAGIAVVKDTIYVSGSELYALKPDGTLCWSFKALDSVDGLTISDKGEVVISSTIQTDIDPDYNKAVLYGITSDGHEKWRLKTGEWLGSSPAFGQGGLFYLTNGGELRALK